MSTKLTTLSDILFGQIRGRVLALLYGWVDKAFYVRQIARNVRASAGAVRRELEKLAAVDLLIRTSVGNLVFYQVNQRHPVFAEMQALVNKTVGIFNILYSTLEPLTERIAVAFVYGSVARQEEKAASDIDLMILGDVELDDVLARLSDTEITLGRAVNPTVYSAHEFRAKLEEGNHFLNSVLNGNKVFLIGNEDELRKMAGVRVVKAGAQQRKRDQSIMGNRAAQSR
ncbi:MAG TPA: nucleotidyltransferase domain-containing protein [Candidatus Angelobacter sp.]|nr:nucleotidyltransferase domain-containing protein [Candidatus Angelobacter sp.]